MNGTETIITRDGWPGEGARGEKSYGTEDGWRD